jgi:hypothetical protein
VDACADQYPDVQAVRAKTDECNAHFNEKCHGAGRQVCQFSQDSMTIVKAVCAVAAVANSYPQLQVMCGTGQLATSNYYCISECFNPCDLLRGKAAAACAIGTVLANCPNTCANIAGSAATTLAANVQNGVANPDPLRAVRGSIPSNSVTDTVSDSLPDWGR